MIDQKVIKKLETFGNTSGQVLSVYLGSDSVQAPSSETLTTQLHSLIHQHVSKEDRVTFKRDITRIEEFLEQYTPSARSVVFFSAGNDLWEVVELEFSLPLSIVVADSPNLAPITEALEKYSKYLVLLVDREKARMFTVEQGELVDQSEFIGGYVPQKVASTGKGGDAGMTDIRFRHNEKQLKQHVDLATKAVVSFTKNDVIDFILIGGHKEMFKKVIDSFPKDLQKKVTGTFVSELNIPLNNILQASKKIAAEQA